MANKNVEFTRCNQDPQKFLRLINNTSNGHDIKSIDEMYQTLSELDTITSIPFARKARIRQAYRDGWHPKWRMYVPEHDWNRVSENVLLGYAKFLAYAPYDTNPVVPGSAFNAIAHFIRNNDAISVKRCYDNTGSIVHTYTPALTMSVCAEYVGIPFESEQVQDIMMKLTGGGSKAEERDLVQMAIDNDERAIKRALSEDTTDLITILYATANQLSTYPEGQAMKAYSLIAKNAMAIK